MNPLKAVGSAIISVPDTIFDGFSKMINRKGAAGHVFGRGGLSGPIGSRSQLDNDNMISNLAILDQVSLTSR